MTTITLDFETYYDDDYTLKKMPIAEYVMDMRFEVLGLAVQVEDEPTQWWHWDEKHHLEDWLLRFPFEEATVVAHNALFDGFILERFFDVHPARWCCTMMMARPIVAPHTGKVALANVADYFKLGLKGDELRNTKGKKPWSFTAEDWERLKTYCVQDVKLTRMCYNLLLAWYEANHVDVT